MAGRPREYSESERKRRRISYQKTHRSQTVFIGESIDDWNLLKTELGISSNPDMAKTLLQSYKNSQRSTGKKRKIHVVTSTPWEQKERDSESEASELSALSSVKACSIPEMSGVEALSEVSNGENHKTPKFQSKKEVCAPKKEMANISMSVEEISEFSLDEAVAVDPDDETYIPSDPDDDDTYIPSSWEISINIPKPTQEDVPYENDINAIVHDIDLDNSDENVKDEKTHGPGIKRLAAVHQDDEDERMVMVSQSSLSFLTDFIPYKVCTRPECAQPLEIKERYIGCGLILRWVCVNGHEILTWASQPVLPNFVLLGNFKFSSAIVLSGNNYRKVALLCKFLKIGIPSQDSFEKVQKNYTAPEVNKYWNTMKQTVQEEVRALDVIVAGDGRMDSPGHSAQYCTYTVMDQSDKDILAMEIVDKRECMLKSTLLEVTGFKKAMRDLDNEGVNVVEVVTDAHPQISKVMKTDYPNMRHSWDMWHGAKNLGKKLCAAAMEKGNSKLKPWIKDITNHFFHCAEKCHGDEMLLKAKFVAVMNHCVNRHEWALGQCDHEPLSDDDRTKEWLSPAGEEVKALEKIILDPRFLNTLRYYVTCQTTSELESFNNHLLMYAAKRQSFSYPAYKCRCQLAAIDYMSHKDRPLRQNKKGELMYSRYFSKAANDWGYKFVKEKKNYSYIPSLMLQILSAYCEEHKERPLSKKREYDLDDPRRIAPTIAPKEPPPTKELVEKRETRLKSSWPKPTKFKEVCSDDSKNHPKASTSEACSEDQEDQSKVCSSE